MKSVVFKFSKSALFPVVLLFASSSLAVAAPFPGENGGHGGGNGGGGEPLFLELTGHISKWLNDSLKDGTLSTKLRLDESGIITASDLELKFSKAVKEVEGRVKFIPQDKLYDECRTAGYKLACELLGTSRTCINSRDPEPAIACNETLFNTKPGDEQFVLTFHEYLGIAGIETDDELDYSRYPISKHLMKFANPKQVVRWELSEKEKPQLPPMVFPLEAGRYKGKLYGCVVYEADVYHQYEWTETPVLFIHVVLNNCGKYGGIAEIRTPCDRKAGKCTTTPMWFDFNGRSFKARTTTGNVVTFRKVSDH